MRFSIVTPVYLHDERTVALFQKCLASINEQSFDHNQFEHVIVNDGSHIPFSVPNYNYIKLVDQPNLQRLTAYNTGLKAARGEIILLLDADDEFTPDCLERIDWYFKKYPKYKMVNFGCTFFHKDGGSNNRDPFAPKKKKLGHQIFGGGQIVNGTFVFKREIYEQLGGFMPHHVENIDCSEIGYGEGLRELWATSPYDVSAYYQMKYPEIRPYFQVVHPDHPKGLVRELGNPFGNDFALFYQYTRKYHSKPIKEYLLKVNLK